ncbi:MAG: DUF6691 family protein [Myxococcota bacterium]
MLAWVAFVAGAVFAVGLGVSGMTLPSKVIGFLDLFGGQWDPSLAFVMGGAVSVYAIAFQLIRRRSKPVIASQFQLPNSAPLVDRRLIAGAVLFGVGWGLGGFCPGPALVSSAALGQSALVFTASMLAGMVMFRAVGVPAQNSVEK